MNRYLDNLACWARGWRQFDTIDFLPGWNGRQWRWRLVYGLDYLATCLIFAGPVVSLSWYIHNRFFSLGYHGGHAGPPLFGTVRCRPAVRVLVPLAWLGLAVAIFS
jgi:hypothetical protein